MLNPSWKAGKHLAMFAGLMLVDIYTRPTAISGFL